MRELHLGFRSYIKISNIIWFSNVAFNGLFKFDVRTGITQFVHRFECLEDNLGLHCDKIYYHDGELIFLPGNSNKIVFYNITTEKESFISIFQDERAYNTAISFIKNNKIWLLSGSIENGIRTLNLETKELKYEKELSDKIYHVCEGVNYISAFQYETKVIITWVNSNCFWEWDIEANSLEFIKIDDMKPDFYKVGFDGDKYWILQVNSCDVYAWDGMMREKKEYTSAEVQWIRDIHTYPYCNFIFAKEKIFLVNYLTYQVMEINKAKGVIEKCFDYPKGCKVIKDRPWVEGWGGMYVEFIIEGSQLWLCPELGNMIVKYDMESGLAEGYELKISMNEIPYMDEILKNIKLNIKVLYENFEMYAVDNYFKIIAANITDIYDSGEIGKRIYLSEAE